VLRDQVKAFLATGGALDQTIEGFGIRDAQIEMAQQIADMIDSGETLLAEAGTGTGKTFAYLIPALLSGKKVIVSTATKTLQQQLVDKDLPLLVTLCGVKGSVVLFKGRENYLCQQRLSLAESQEQNTKADWQKLAPAEGVVSTNENGRSC